MSNDIDESKRRRRGGSSNRPSVDLRTHTVSTRLNKTELVLLDELRSPLRMERGEFLRTASLHKLPPTIPAINVAAWSELARTTANLNQIAKKLNMEENVDFAEVKETLAELRLRLVDVGEVFKHEGKNKSRRGL